MHSLVISVWSASWLVHDQPRDQCMISHMNSARSAKRSVHDNHIISVWSASWSEHDEPRDQCMISHVISACAVSWSVYDQVRDHDWSNWTRTQPLYKCLCFYSRNDAKAETPVLWPPHGKSWLIGKDSNSGRDWGRRRRGRQRMRWLDDTTDSMDVSLSEV